MTSTSPVISSTWAALLALLLAGAPATAQNPAPGPEGHAGHGMHHHAAPEAAEPAQPALPAPQRIERLQIPDVTLVDQDGRPVRLYRDLIQGKVVAVNFVFTSCTAVCPPMGAIFGQVRKQLGDRAGRDVHLISVSVDPATDTPARMKEWGARFGAGPGWTLVTGPGADIARVLKAFGVYTANLNDHSPQVIVGNDARGEWTRAYGLAPPTTMLALLDQVAARPAAAAMHAASGSPAERYFGDIKLVDQDGRERRLYSDLMAGKTVVIDVIFTTCTGVCPVLSRNFQRLQEALGDRIGRDVQLVSISVDPENDTPARLKEYAARFHAGPGWSFLTGSKADVDAALRKLGQWVEKPGDHQNLILIGNDRTGLWKKAFGLAEPEAILQVVQSVVDDRG
jgi:cytochrome oxidase Cu insertion factor (SCO1/SenC/PrrC family)